MFISLFLKEIQETIFTYRFLIAAQLCLVLLPPGVYISLLNYHQQVREYENCLSHKIRTAIQR